MKILQWLLVSVLFSTCHSLVFALDPTAYAIQATAQVQSSPAQIRLQWPENSNVRQYIIRRKTIHENSWSGPIATLPGNSTGYTDTQVTPGVSYEYEIEAPTSFYPWPQGDSSKWVTAWGYVNSGIEVPALDLKGKVVLVVDAEVAPSLANELNTYVMNLVGAGWQVVRKDVSRSASVSQVRSIIQNEYNADPTNVKSVILFGHVAVPYSGAIYPDMHIGHRGAWPADVIYGDVNGQFTDNSVNITNSEVPENNNVPGDGKFDQSVIPSPVELEVGRIDMWNLPEFSPRNEIDLLRRYLQKNHAFRHRHFAPVRRALIRDNFGDFDGDAPAVDAWRFFPGMVGANMIQVVGSGQFIPRLNSDTFLWAYGCGGGGDSKADGVGTTADFAANDPKAVFYILHGSYFGDFNTQNNFLRASTAVQNYGLAAIWSGLPHWYMHHLSLGQTLGFATKIAQNNRSLYKSHLNFSAGEVHIGLIGDPTLQVLQVAPPSNISSRVGVGLNLSWNASADPVAGYYVYYSQNETGPYQRITSSITEGTSFAQRTLAQGTHYYMVRAVKLETTPSGTFYNASQGEIIKVVKDGTSTPDLPVLTVTVDDGDSGEANQNQGKFRITRDTPGSANLAVNVELSGTAANGFDYQTVPNSVTIGSGTTVAFINIIPLQDNLKEGDETIQVTIKPSSAYSLGNPASATLTIKDHYLNQPPSISTIPDQTIDQNTATQNISFTVSDTDTPLNSLVLTATSSNQGLIPNNNLTLGGSGNNRTIRAVPTLNQTGSSLITVTVSDGSVTANRSFTVNVRAVNRPPIANNQNVQVGEDAQTSVVLTGSDPDGNTLVYSILSNPVKGSLTGTPPNLTYRPQANVNGSDAFTFRVSDGTLFSEPATIQVTITPVNDTPVAASQSLELPEDSTKPIVLNGTDLDGNTLTYLLKSQPSKGTLTGTPPNLLYRPNTNVFGMDSFTFAVSDGVGESAIATVLLTITPQNDVPVALAQSVEVQEDGVKAILLAGSDVEGANLTFILKSQPQKGALTGTPPNLTYKPATNATGADSFTFSVSDGLLESAPATVSLSIIPQNDSPIIAPIPDLILAKGVVPPPIAIQIIDVDTPRAELVITGKSSNETLLPSANITFTTSNGQDYVHVHPNSSVTGSAIVTLKVNDNSNTAEISFSLTVRDEAPRIMAIELGKDGTATINFQGSPGAAYRVQGSILDGSQWETISQGTADANGNGLALDGAAKNVPFRIYRVEWR